MIHMACSGTNAAVKSHTSNGRLRCVVVSAVFPPEFTFSATTSAAIAEELAERGHDVTVLAPFPNKPAGKLFPGYRRSLYSKRQMPRGYTLIHCFGTLAPKSRILSRFMENLSFGLTAGVRLLIARKPDVIYSNAWPVFATSIIMTVAKLRGVPVVVSVQDVYPESLVAQSRAAKDSRMVRLLRRVDRYIADSAEALILVSQAFRDAYENTRAVHSTKLHVVWNWGDADAIKINPDKSMRYRESKGIPRDAIVAVYGGNVGPASGAEGLVEAFAQLKELPIYLVIAGAGSNLVACIARAKKLGLERVIFHSPWELEQTGVVLGAADVLLLPTIAGQSAVSMPSKLISYMFSGKPIIAQVIAESDTATLIQAAQAGWTIAPDHSDLLAATLREVCAVGSNELLRLGTNGRRFALENLSRQSNLPKVLDVICSAAQAGKGSSPTQVIEAQS